MSNVVDLNDFRRSKIALPKPFVIPYSYTLQRSMDVILVPEEVLPHLVDDNLAEKGRVVETDDILWVNPLAGFVPLVGDCEKAGLGNHSEILQQHHLETVGFWAPCEQKGVYRGFMNFLCNKNMSMYAPPCEGFPSHVQTVHNDSGIQLGHFVQAQCFAVYDRSLADSLGLTDRRVLRDFY